MSTHRLQFAEYVLAKNIADESRPLESGTLNMASPKIQKYIRQIQFPKIIIRMTPLSFSSHSPCCCIYALYFL